MNIKEAFGKIATLGNLLGAGPLNKWPACWEIDVDERWAIAVNGHRNTRKDSRGGDVPPYHASIWYNGWPAGLISPVQGVIAAGSEANEDNFIAALDKRINTELLLRS